MYGILGNFPDIIHNLANYTTSASTRRLQQVLTKAFRELNKKSLDFEAITGQSFSDFSVGFEFGIAETDGFNYVDDRELSRILKTVRKECFSVMDFFCRMCYCKRQGNRVLRLRSDYYFMRFVFGEREVSLQIHHEKGPRYISPEDISLFLERLINEASSKGTLKIADVS